MEAPSLFCRRKCSPRLRLTNEVIFEPLKHHYQSFQFSCPSNLFYFCLAIQQCAMIHLSLGFHTKPWDPWGCPELRQKNRPLKSSRPFNSGIIGLCSPPMQLMSQLYSKTDSFPLLFAVSSHFEVFSFQNAFVISVLNLVLFVSLLWVLKCHL